jgi:hypothetical protein
MKDETNTIKIPTADTYLLTQVKYLLRNYIGSGERFLFEQSEEWQLKITAGDISSNTINALAPLIIKHKLIWFVTAKGFISCTDVQMTLFKPKRDIMNG